MNLTGEVINHTPMSSLIRVKSGNSYYYLKTYRTGGKGVRRYLGFSRLRTEYTNAMTLQRLNVTTLPILGFGEYRNGSFDRYGALLTRELTNHVDLARIGRTNAGKFKDVEWVNAVIGRLAIEVRKMHSGRFVHGDLKWRNLLVTLDQDTQVYIIDSPMGRHFESTFFDEVLGGLFAGLSGKLFDRGVVKDLACLDKLGKIHLSKSKRLGFLKAYLGIERLGESEKALITRILEFFKDRD